MTPGTFKQMFVCVPNCVCIRATMQDGVGMWSHSYFIVPGCIFVDWLQWYRSGFLFCLCKNKSGWIHFYHILFKILYSKMFFYLKTPLIFSRLFLSQKLFFLTTVRKQRQVKNPQGKRTDITLMTLKQWFPSFSFRSYWGKSWLISHKQPIKQLPKKNCFCCSPGSSVYPPKCP